MAITAEDIFDTEEKAAEPKAEKQGTSEQSQPSKPTRKITAQDVLSQQVAPVASKTESTEPFVKPRVNEQHRELVMTVLSKTGEGREFKFRRGIVNAGNGLVQLTLDVAESLGLAEPGTADQFTNLTNEERREVEEFFKKEFGEGFSFSVAEFTGEILPFMAVPVNASTAMGRSVLAALTGALAGGSVFIPEEDRGDRMSQRAVNTAIGTGAGALTAAGVEGVSKLRNFVSDTVARAINQNKKFAARGVELSERTGIKLKLSQVTSDPTIESIEALARGSSRGERMARALELEQPKQALKAFRRMLPNIERRKVGDPVFANRVRTAFDSVMGDTNKGTGLLGTRAANGRANFKAAQEAGGEIPVGRTLSALNETIEQMSGPGAGRQNARLVKELSSIRDSLLKEGKGVLTPLQLQQRLQEWGRAARGSGKLFSDKVDRAAELGPAKKIYGALNDDLDDAISKGGNGAEALKKARDQWRTDTAAIREVEDSALGKMFGKSSDITIEEIESKFLRMDPSEINTVMRILENSDPQIRRGLQRFWLEDAINSARSAGQGDTTQFIPGKLLDLKKGRNREKFEAVFNDPKTRKMVNEGLEAVSRIMINNYKTGGRSVQRLRDLTSVLATRSFPSALEMGSNLFAPNMVSKYVLNPQGVRALQELSKPNSSVPTAATLAKLMTIAMEPQTDPSVDKDVEK